MSNCAMNNETDLDWLARNVHVWPEGKREALVCYPRNVDALIWSRISSNVGWITKDQWLARRAELQNKPGWDKAEDWAEWLAQDQDGEWKWLAGLPGKYVDGWTAVKIKGCCKGLALGDWRDTLEKRPDMYKNKEEIDTSSECVQKTSESAYEFEPFVSVEDAATAKHATITPSKYTKTIHGVSVDVYDVLQAWGVSNPALQHLIKKALQCGQRGHKDNAQDLQDIIDSAIRAKELE